MTTEDIVRYCTRDHGQYFWDVQENAKIATGPFFVNIGAVSVGKIPEFFYDCSQNFKMDAYYG